MKTHGALKRGGSWDHGVVVTNCWPKGAAPNAAFIIVIVELDTLVFFKLPLTFPRGMAHTTFQLLHRIFVMFI